MNGRLAERKGDLGGVLPHRAGEQAEDHRSLGQLHEDMKSQDWLNKVFSSYGVRYATRTRDLSPNETCGSTTYKTAFRTLISI